MRLKQLSGVVLAAKRKHFDLRKSEHFSEHDCTYGGGGVNRLAAAPNTEHWCLERLGKNPFPSKIPTRIERRHHPAGNGGNLQSSVASVHNRSERQLTSHCTGTVDCHMAATPQQSRPRILEIQVVLLHEPAGTRGSSELQVIPHWPQIGEIDDLSTRQPVNVGVHVPSRPVPAEVSRPSAA